MKFFFNKKKSILPLLQGSVDIHCHVLPGLDDGAKDMKDTKNMLSAYKKMGFKEIIATPHILKGSYPNSKKTILSALGKVSSEIEDLNIISNASAEYMLDEDFDTFLKEDEFLPLKNQYILVEMSYFQKPNNLWETIFSLRQKGYIPVLAHPERYNFIEALGRFRHYKKIGCLFQLNFLSLTDHYGSAVHKKANMLLKHEMYDFAATDAHHLDHLDRIAQISLSNNKYDLLHNIIDRTTATFSKDWKWEK